MGERVRQWVRRLLTRKPAKGTFALITSPEARHRPPAVNTTQAEESQ